MLLRIIFILFFEVTWYYRGMHKVLRSLLFLALFGVVSFALLPAAQAEDWQIDNFHSDIAIQSDGKVVITEKIDVDFRFYDKHGIFRELPYAYSDQNGNKTYTEIAIQEVDLDNQDVAYKVEKSPANIRIKIGDANKTISGKHTFTIRYTAVGILRSFGTYDELYWNVTGNEWPVEIKQASATVQLPQPGVIQFSCYRGIMGSNASCDSTKRDDRAVNFSTNNPLGSGEGLTVAVGYTPGMVPILSVSRPPTLAEQIQFMPLILAFLITFGVGTLLIVRKWWQTGRDWWFGPSLTGDGMARRIPFGTKVSIAPEFAPPGNLRPAEIGVLVDEKADTLDVTSTIVDLAARGYLTITEENKKWLFGSKDYILKQKKTELDDLLLYERNLMQALFATGKEVSLSSLKNKFYKQLADIKIDLEINTVLKNLFAGSPQIIRNKYYVISVAILLSASLLYSFGLPRISFTTTIFWIIAGLASGLFVDGIIMLLFVQAMPARTAHGYQLYRQALGYKLFIEKAEKYRAQWLEKEHMFEQVLPYAIVFGVTEQLARAMKVLELKPPQPGWYIGPHPFSPTVFANDINGFSSTLSTAMASSPTSSGSGGGGFSGGGFGGGGGGGW